MRNCGEALTETTYFVLLSVYSPNHGYGMRQFIRRKTDGRLIPGAGTLYGAIRLLLKKGWIAPIGPEGNRGKQEYLITASGKSAVEAELSRMEQACRAGWNIIRKGGIQE